MIKTLKESKAKLSELVELASQGEDTLITVRGKVKAKLVGVTPQDKVNDMESWVLELKRLQQTYSTGQMNLTVEDILTEDRQERF